MVSLSIKGCVVGEALKEWYILKTKKLAGSPAERRWATTGVVKQDTGWREKMGRSQPTNRGAALPNLFTTDQWGERWRNRFAWQRGECSPQIVKQFSIFNFFNFQFWMAAWRVFTPDCKTILSLLVIWENMISALSTLTIEQQNLHFVNTQLVYLDVSK